MQLESTKISFPRLVKFEDCLSGMKHVVQVVKPSKTCLWWVVHNPLLNITSKKWKKKQKSENLRIGIRETSEHLNLSYGSAQQILLNVLGRLMPKDLNLFQKLRRIDVAKAILDFEVEDLIMYNYQYDF